MNKLSLLLYLVNVVENFGVLFVVLGTAFFLVFGIAIIVSISYAGCSTVEQNDKTRRKARFWAYVTGPMFLVFFILAAFCPSSDTLNSILAYEQITAPAP